MKPIRVTFAALLIIFFVFWGIKVNMPVDRPSNIKEEEQEAWYDKDYKHLYGDNDWFLNGYEQEYKLLEGYDSIYYIEQVDGTYKYYKLINEEYVEIDFTP